MKYKLGIIIFLFLNYNVEAQIIQKCATVDKFEELKKTDPSLDDKRIFIEQQIREWSLKNSKSKKLSTLITVPVVFHVLYKIPSENISDAQILSQLDVLNNDFRRLNADTINTPFAFKSLAADCEIQFCLAQRDPLGNPSNGITRTPTTIDKIGSTNSYYSSAAGGHDIWNRDQYLNIWICNIDSGITLGFAYLPGSPSNIDGIVLNYRAVGTMGTATPPYDEGRTATHEVGHWFNLLHTWGDDGGSCTGSDQVSDTPNQADETYGCPSYPQISCSNFPNGDMFMNYMDYCDDECFNLFTLEQKTRMHAAINTSRPGLLTSLGCSPVGINDLCIEKNVQLFPNPTNGTVEILIFSINTNYTASINVYNLLGEIVLEKDYSINSQTESFLSLDLSTLKNGIYSIEISTPEGRCIKRVILSH